MLFLESMWKAGKRGLRLIPSDVDSLGFFVPTGARAVTGVSVGRGGVQVAFEGGIRCV